MKAYTEDVDQETTTVEGPGGKAEIPLTAKIEEDSISDTQAILVMLMRIYDVLMLQSAGGKEQDFNNLLNLHEQGKTMSPIPSIRLFE